MLCGIRDNLNRGFQAFAMGELTCLMKAIIQLSKDDGKWETAVLLLPYSDPNGGLDFGGTEAEMAAIYHYKKSSKELKTQINEE